MKGKKFIYNWQLANFMIQEGVKCIETGCNKGEIFWVFNYQECQDAYEKWNNKKIQCRM